MKIKRKIWAGVGVLACVCVGLRMRELGLARPVLVGTKVFNALQMRVSRDGQWLWTRDGELFEETFALQPPTPRPPTMNDTSGKLPEAGQAFHAAHGIDSFPLYWSDRGKQATYFVRREGEKTVVLPFVVLDYGVVLGWSLVRREIYSFDGYEISIWKMNNGNLKGRARVGGNYLENAVFSPEGRFLFGVQTEGAAYRLRRYDVQSGKSLLSPAIPDLDTNSPPLRFSADEKYLLVGGRGDSRVMVLDAANWKRLWEVESVLCADFAPGGRVGLAKTNRFEWRDVRTGKLLQTQPNPAKGTELWTLSPDGHWIYAFNEKKQIVRWRAR